MPARSYVIVVLALAAALCAAVVALDARVDPYGLATVPDRTNLAPDAPRPGAFFRKALTVREAMPRTIVLGTSRAEFGIDPRAPGFASRYLPVLNVALGGLSIEQMRLLLIHANTVSPLKLAVIGLDLESFLDAGRTDFDPAALEGNPESEPPLLGASAHRRLARGAWGKPCAPGRAHGRSDGPRALRRATGVRSAAPSTVSSGRVFCRFIGPSSATSSAPSSAASSAGSTAVPSAATVPARNWRMTDRALRLWEGQHGLIWVAEYDNFYSRIGLFFSGPVDRLALGRRSAAARGEWHRSGSCCATPGATGSSSGCSSRRSMRATSNGIGASAGGRCTRPGSALSSIRSTRR
jgi:hypothetical protein